MRMGSSCARLRYRANAVIRSSLTGRLAVNSSLGILVRAALVGIALAQLTGCATIVKGHSQQINVATDPPGAACELQRDGTAIATVNPTPGMATVEKSRKDLAISCRKSGYFDADGKVVSKFHPMTFGNVLFGGIIGFGIDAASGAMMEYEESISVRLIPQEFPSTAERDAYFDSLREQVSAQSTKAMEELSKHCSGQSDCDKKRSLAEKSRESALADIEAKRASAKLHTS
jgi:hypothetical protein